MQDCWFSESITTFWIVNDVQRNQFGLFRGKSQDRIGYMLRNIEIETKNASEKVGSLPRKKDRKVIGCVTKLLKVASGFEPAAVREDQSQRMYKKGRGRGGSGVYPGQLYHVIRGVCSSGHVPGAISLS